VFKKSAAPTAIVRIGICREHVRKKQKKKGQNERRPSEPVPRGCRLRWPLAVFKKRRIKLDAKALSQASDAESSTRKGGADIRKKVLKSAKGRVDPESGRG